MQAVQTLSKIFSAFLLHQSIELELLITNIYILALANTFFRSKNTKNSKGADFREKYILSQNVQNFQLYSYFLLLKLTFSNSASKAEYREVVKLNADPNP